MNKSYFLGALSLCFMAATAVAKPSDQTIQLKIVETSDVHGFFFPYDFIENTPLEGTLARVNTYMKKQHELYGDRVLLIDNGDILQGQPTCYWSNYVMPQDENIAASIINYMGYDAETVGNHDVETGHAVYDKWIREVRCPMLGANIVKADTKVPYVKPYAICERTIGTGKSTQTVRVAILGMITPTIPCWLNVELYQGLEFQEMVACAKHWIQVIKEKEKADIIVGLFHSGLNGGICLPSPFNSNETLLEDASGQVAQQVEGFDAIFFGHDHMVHNMRLKNPAGQEVVCVDPSCYAMNVAEVTFNLTYRNKKLIKKEMEGNIVSMGNVAIDEQLVAHFQPQIDQIKQYVGRKIGTFTRAAYTRDSYFGPSAFTDFIHELQLRITGADISFNAPLSFDSSIKQGDVTVADMFKLYRFENKLYVLKLSGKEIKGHLEMSYDLWVNTMKSANDHLLLLNDKSYGDQQRQGFQNYTFNFDSAAGIEYEVDVTKPNGQKLHILRMADGTPFDENKYYKVVMNSYRGNGGGELLIRGAGIPKDSLDSRIVYRSELDLRYYLMQEIERMGVVTPKAGKNWQFVPKEWTEPAALRDRKLLFGDENQEMR